MGSIFLAAGSHHGIDELPVSVVEAAVQKIGGGPRPVGTLVVRTGEIERLERIVDGTYLEERLTDYAGRIRAHVQSICHEHKGGRAAARRHLAARRRAMAVSNSASNATAAAGSAGTAVCTSTSNMTDATGTAAACPSGRASTVIVAVPESAPGVNTTPGPGVRC